MEHEGPQLPQWPTRKRGLHERTEVGRGGSCCMGLEPSALKTVFTQNRVKSQKVSNHRSYLDETS